MNPVAYLVDTSAIVRLSQNADLGEVWARPVAAGLISVCSIVELEFLHTARSPAHRASQLALLRDAYSWVVMPDRVFERAEEMQAVLTDHGLHRSAGAVDLLVAATAELHGLTLLHYDHDFEQVGQFTDLLTRWVAPPGTID